MSIRRIFLFLLVATVFVAAAGIPISPGINTDFVISGTIYDSYGSGLPGVVLDGFPGEVVDTILT